MIVLIIFFNILFYFYKKIIFSKTTRYFCRKYRLIKTDVSHRSLVSVFFNDLDYINLSPVIYGV